MPEQSSMHWYLSWTKERNDEMDAILASLESRTSELKAEAKTKADQLIAEMKKRRDDFQANAKAHAEAGEAAWHTAKAQLDSEWHGFEAQVKTYFEGVDKQLEQQQATFRDVAAAQATAWQDAAEKLHRQAGQVAEAGRAEVEAKIKQLRADAAEAEARLQKLKQAGTESWTALSAALAESRKAFDRANQHAWDAVKRAASSSS